MFDIERSNLTIPARPAIAVPSIPRPTDPLEELNRRKAALRDRARGVALGLHTGFYLCGRAGTGKTHDIRKTLEEEGCKYQYHDGHLTPMGLFDLLNEYHDQVIVLDDVAELFTQRIALQHLLAALGHQPDEAGARIVKYRRQGSETTIHFSGGIIMISNLDLQSGPVLEALKSRVHYLRYDPTDEQMAAMMRAIAAKGWRTLTPEECMEVADFLIGESLRIGCHLDLRLLVDKSFPDYLQYQNGDTESHWKDLVRITLEARLVELKHTTPARLSRREVKEQEQGLVQEIVAEYHTKEDQIAVWQAETGKSERAFYRRLEEIGTE